MESEISGLPDLHAFIKYENYVTGFSFPYIDIEEHQIPFERRHLPDEKLTFDPKNIKAKARDGTAAPPSALPTTPRPAVDLEAKQVEENAAGAAPDAGKKTGAEADNIVNAEEPTQTTLDFIAN
jgi:hypothetical protein